MPHLSKFSFINLFLVVLSILFLVFIIFSSQVLLTPKSLDSANNSLNIPVFSNNLELV